MKTEELSLRAQGLLSIIQTKTQGVFTLEMLTKYTSDKTFFIENTLKELIELNIIIPKDKGYIIKKETQSADTVTLHSRVTQMFRENRAYSIVAWFLEEIGYQYTDDESLRRRVVDDHKYAHIVQFWDDAIIKDHMAYLMNSEDKSEVILKNLLILLQRRDRGDRIC